MTVVSIGITDIKFHANGSYNNVVVCTHRCTLWQTPLSAILVFRFHMST